MDEKAITLDLDILYIFYINNICRRQEIMFYIFFMSEWIEKSSTERASTGCPYLHSLKLCFAYCIKVNAQE